MSTAEPQLESPFLSDHRTDADVDASEETVPSMVRGAVDSGTPGVMSEAADLRSMEADGNRQVRFYLAGLFLLVLLVLVLSYLAPEAIRARFSTFVTIFLGILIEALPFLLAGSIVSGLIETFVARDMLARFVPKRAAPAALAGALLGFVFPVCECGVVPVTRRLYSKGLPVSVGIAFLLAAPVANPIVVFSTYAAFGFGPVLLARLFFSILIAVLVGLIFSLAGPEEVLRSETAAGMPVWTRLQKPHPEPDTRSTISRLLQVTSVSADDFLDMGRYLVIGSLLAAGMQTLIPQSTLLALGSGQVVSVLVLMALAFILSVCSTVDAFLALSFVNNFTVGSIMAFLIFGPMVDIKSSLMFLGVFRRRTVVYLILLPLLLSLLVGVFLNLQVGL